jgi:hypothetical protein
MDSSNQKEQNQEKPSRSDPGRRQRGIRFTPIYKKQKTKGNPKKTKKYKRATTLSIPQAESSTMEGN